MSRLAAAIAANNRPKHAVCSIAKLLTDLPKAEAADLRDAIADHTYTGAAISAGLKSLGHQVSGLTVNRHRRGVCACPR